MFMLMNVLSLVLIAWYSLLFVVGLHGTSEVLFNFISQESFSACFEEDFASAECRRIGSVICDVLGLLTALYGALGILIFVFFIVMYNTLYVSYWRNTTDIEEAPKARDYQWQKELKACVSCGCNAECAINVSRKSVSCFLCPFGFAFLLLSIVGFTNIDFDRSSAAGCKLSPDSQNDFLIGSDTPSNGTLIVPKSMEITFWSLIIQWILVALLALWGCSVTAYQKHYGTWREKQRRTLRARHTGIRGGIELIDDSRSTFQNTEPFKT